MTRIKEFALRPSWDHVWDLRLSLVKIDPIVFFLLKNLNPTAQFQAYKKENWLYSNWTFIRSHSHKKIKIIEIKCKNREHMEIATISSHLWRWLSLGPAAAHGWLWNTSKCGNPPTYQTSSAFCHSVLDVNDTFLMVMYNYKELPGSSTFSC